MSKIRSKSKSKSKRKNKTKLIATATSSWPDWGGEFPPENHFLG